VSLTVRDIAKRIARRSADVEIIVGRLRHWTAEGLLSPTGEKNPGTGRSRTYSESALEDAVILNALADMGLQIALMRPALTLARHAKAEWREKAKRGVALFLEIDTMPNGKRFPHLHESNWFKEDADHALVFNLTQLFARLQARKE